MKVVGTDGKYQYILIVLFCVVTLLTGQFALGSPYYFAVAPYTCSSDISECDNFVCSLPE